MKIYKEISKIESECWIEALNSVGLDNLIINDNKNISITVNIQMPYDLSEYKSVLRFLSLRNKFKLILEKINENI